MDFIVDLHSTTANMGLSIVVSNESAITVEGYCISFQDGTKTQSL